MAVLLDSCVYLAAMLGKADERERAWEEISADPGEVWISELICLETASALWRNVLQKLSAAEKQEILAELRKIWGRLGNRVKADDALMLEAQALVDNHPQRGLGTLDAIHAASALRVKAELVTAEKATKPFFSVPGLRCRSIHMAAGIAGHPGKPAP